MCHRCKIIGKCHKNAMGRNNAVTPDNAGYHETLSQRKNWGSVHHTAYILPSKTGRVKYYMTKTTC